MWKGESLPPGPGRGPGPPPSAGATRPRNAPGCGSHGELVLKMCRYSSVSYADTGAEGAGTGVASPEKGMASYLGHVAFGELPGAGAELPVASADLRVASPERELASGCGNAASSELPGTGGELPMASSKIGVVSMEGRLASCLGHVAWGE